jgi:dephospho-CoA kinase
LSKRKPIIGLAGGIGSGKSTVAKVMGQMGGLVVDADAIARRTLDEPEVLRQLEQWWGPEVLTPDGRADRQRIGQIVFNDPVQRERLERLVHPKVAAERDRLLADGQRDERVRFIVLDVPLLYEVGLAGMCDRVVFVNARPEVRLNRVMSQRGWDAQELGRREKNQWPVDRKLKLADDIIDNNEGEPECSAQVKALLDRTLSNI